MINHYLQEEFKNFISENINRQQWIENWLTKNSINYNIISINNQNHIYINFPKTSYNQLFRIKTILVHYDRVGIGANDNSAAVYQVLYWVKNLFEDMSIHNVRVFFTDGEELGLSDENNSQGSLGIANTFKRIGITDEDIYAIDTCGRGDVLVISSAGKNTGSKAFLNKFSSLYERTIELAKSSCSESWITVPTPYSDNAAFLACGIPAIGITVLPKDEATLYMRNLQMKKNTSEFYPLTWKMLHTPNDNICSLTNESWELMQKFLTALAKSKTIA